MDWFFDVISPFAYLQHECLMRDRPDLEFQYKPILLAGLLSHWGSKGPAEIPKKRLFTYRHTLWMARRENIPFKAPPGHPFNPLKALRLILAAGCTRDNVAAVFRHIWAEGRDLDCPEFTELARTLGVEDLRSSLARDEIKAALKKNTDEALRQGIFGVPTIIASGEMFWGLDATDMVLDYLEQPDLFEDSEMKRIKSLPMSASRF